MNFRLYLHEKFLVLSLFSFTLDNTSLGWSNLFLFLFQRRKFFFYTFDEIYTRGLIDRSNNTIESQPFHYTRRALNFTLEVLLANLDIFINVEVRVRIEQLSIIRSIDRSTDRSSTENKRKKKKDKTAGNILAITTSHRSETFSNLFPVVESVREPRDRGK